MTVIGQRFHFDREQLKSLSAAHGTAYRTAQPFPHTVIDDFLPPAALEDVLAEFPSPQQADWFRFDSRVERKLATKDETAMGEATRHLLAEFNSAAFVDFLQDLTGITGLVPDPHLVGGGLHQIERGGHLNIHADFNRHPGTDLERRLNVLLYLNHDWLASYGGALELWETDMSACAVSVLPVFNRCVVFNTTDLSFHGHPDPLNCPEDRTRKSLALYYYSKHGPAPDSVHNTLFQRRPGEAAPPPPAARRPRRARAIAMRVAPPIAVDAARWIRGRVRSSAGRGERR